MNIPARILFDRAFADGDLGHGGQRRSRQIAEVLTSAFDSVTHQGQPVSLAQSLNSTQLVQSLAQGAWQFTQRPQLRRLGVRSMARVGFTVVECDGKLRSDSPHAIVWEATKGPRIVAAWRYAARHQAVVAVPQNIERLAINPSRWRSHPKLSAQQLTLELEALRLSDAVFAISREEQWLLANFGIPADFLPYYPPAAALEELLSVRVARQSVAPSDFILVLGTAGNGPTERGLREIVEIVSTHPSSWLPYRLVFVGSGTHRLAPPRQHSGMEFKGFLAPTELAELLATSSGVLVHQPFGTGALTRVIDQLVAAIPVICTPHAARTVARTPGVTVIEHLTLLSEALRSPLAFPPLPHRPTEAESRLVSRIVTAIHGRRV